MSRPGGNVHCIRVKRHGGKRPRFLLRSCRFEHILTVNVYHRLRLQNPQITARFSLQCIQSQFINNNSEGSSNLVSHNQYLSVRKQRFYHGRPPLGGWACLKLIVYYYDVFRILLYSFVSPRKGSLELDGRKCCSYNNSIMVASSWYRLMKHKHLENYYKNQYSIIYNIIITARS